jgi:lysophospholipase L1-like esterase
MPERLAKLRVNALYRQLVLSLAAVLITLPLLEVTVRLLKPQNPDFYDSERFLRFDPVRGELRNIPNSTGQYTGVPLRINSIGLRDHEVDVPKPPGVFRILAIGDSVTFGFGVRLEDSYPKRLEALLNASRNTAADRVEVLNAAVPGTALVSYLKTLRQEGPSLQPDLILVGIVLNDIMDYDAVFAPRPSSSPRPSMVSTRLHELNRVLLLHSHLYLLSYISLKSFLIHAGAFDINSAYDFDFLAVRPPTERQARAWASSLKILNQIIDAARDLRVPVVLVVFPLAVQMNKQTLDLFRRSLNLTLDESALDGAPQKRLAEFALAHRVPLVDLLPGFRKSGSLALFLSNRSISHDWAHPSPAGHDLAASELLSALQRFHLAQLPPKRRVTMGASADVLQYGADRGRE